MDLDAFKIICAPAWPPRVTSSLATKIQGKPDCLEARRLLWFLGPEVWNVVLTMTQTPTPPPPLYKGPHPAVLLWSDSQYCAVSHGEEIIPHWSDQALAGTGRVVREEMYGHPMVKGREKKRDRQRK